MFAFETQKRPVAQVRLFDRKESLMEHNPSDILMTYLAGNRYLRTKRLEERAEQHRLEHEAARAKAESRKPEHADAAVQEPDSAAENGKKTEEDRAQ